MEIRNITQIFSYIRNEKDRRSVYQFFVSDESLLDDSVKLYQELNKLFIKFFITKQTLHIHNFLDFHYGDYEGNKRDFLDELVSLVEICLDQQALPDLSYHERIGLEINIRIAKEWIYNEKQELNKIKPSNKVKWNCKPELFGWLFMELVNKGFIEAPLRSGETNYAALARFCNEHFELKSTTTLGNMERVLNPDKNQLAYEKKQKFTIPYLNDLK